MNFETHMIAFPGLGIPDMKISERAFSILGRDVAWYGIIITAAIFIAMFFAVWRGVKDGIKLDDMLDFAIFSVPAAMVGGRLYYVVFNLGQYDSFYSVIAVWEGGIAVYGGIIFGLLTGIIISKIKKINPLKVFDAVAPAIMLGQIIGRWGNFVNAEAYGTETSLPWRMSIRLAGISEEYAKQVHPTFLYESLWNLAGLALILLFLNNKRKKYNGQVFLFYAAWYGLGRAFIEGLRTDSLYFFDTGIRVSQVVGLLSFAAGTALYIILLKKARKKDEADYESLYNLDSLAEPVLTEEAEDNPAAAVESGEKGEVPAEEIGKAGEQKELDIENMKD